MHLLSLVSFNISSTNLKSPRSLIFMKLTNFILMWAEHEKGIIKSVSGML